LSLRRASRTFHLAAPLAGRVLLALLPLLLASGCVTPQERQAQSAVNDYFAGDYPRSAELLRPLSENTDQNFVLNNLRLGSVELMQHRYDDAENAFLRAYEVLNSYGVNDGGRTLGAVLVDEKIKIWKGEPYERAMANFYLGVIYYIRADYANARGAFENALFKLKEYADEKKKDSKDDVSEIDSNFAVASLMLGKCWQKLGREDLARANFDRAVQINPRLSEIASYDRNEKSNLLLIVEFGKGPEKVTNSDGAVVGFAPTPAQVPPPPLVRVRVDGRFVTTPETGEPLVDTVVMAQDRHWQSIDTIRAIKSVVGTGLLIGGAFEGARGLNESGSAQRRDLTAAAIMLGTGLLLKATSQADVRQWEMLPRSVYVIPLHVTPGTHDVLVDFAGLPGLKQTWHNLVVPDTGEATYYMRLRRWESGPFTWPPSEGDRLGHDTSIVQTPPG
jgi:tetratricopeptide (TPR) repeat protein